MDEEQFVVDLVALEVYDAADDLKDAAEDLMYLETNDAQVLSDALASAIRETVKSLNSLRETEKKVRDFLQAKGRVNRAHQ